jgi:similar to stage IV sporulation protein
MPLKYSIKCYSGQVRKVKSVIIGKKFINFYLNSGNPGVKCDKIEDRKILVLPGGICLPATVVTTAYYPYEVQEAELTVEEAEAQLQERLKKYLLEKLTDGEIREMEFSRDVSNGVVTVTMTAECVEEIAAMRQMTSEELAANENIADTEE